MSWDADIGALVMVITLWSAYGVFVWYMLRSKRKDSPKRWGLDKAGRR